jgi:hypothetical protein
MSRRPGETPCGRVPRRREPSTDLISSPWGKAMSPADYRSYAAELLMIADHIGDHQSRAALLAMAQSWQHLAAKAEKNLQTQEPQQ